MAFCSKPIRWQSRGNTHVPYDEPCSRRTVFFKSVLLFKETRLC